MTVSDARRGEEVHLGDDPAYLLRMALKTALWERLEQPIEPGMGGPPEPIWETYKPEGVAILLANHLAPLFEHVECRFCGCTPSEAAGGPCIDGRPHHHLLALSGGHLGGQP